MDASAIEHAVLALAASGWIYPLVYLLVVGDAFLVILPSETVVVALGALALSSGSPSLALLLPTAAVGAVTGDLLCFLIGRRVGLDRWRWQRAPRIARALEGVRATVTTRTAVLVFTARYIPFARIAVNLTAGASGLALRRYLPLSAMAGAGWAVYNVAIGATFGAILGDRPVLAILVSVVVAIGLGIGVDAVIRGVSARRARAAASAFAQSEQGVSPAP